MNKLLCLSLLISSVLLGMEQPCLTYYSWELGGTEEVMLRIPKKHVLELVNPKLLDAWGSKCSASAGFLARLDAKANLRGEGARERLWKYCKENLEQGSENGYRVVHGSTPPWAGNEEHAMKLLLAQVFSLGITFLICVEATVSSLVHQQES